MLLKTTQSIPDIYISRVYNPDDPECDVHYETFGRLAEFFGRNTPAHRHSRFFQVHLLTRGSIRLNLDDQVYCGDAPLAFLTPPAVPHALYSEGDTDGHVITVRQETVRAWCAATQGQWPEGNLRTATFLPLSQFAAEYQPEVERLLHIAEMLQRESASKEAGRSAALQVLGQYLFISLQRLLVANVPSQASKRERGEDLRIFLKFCDLVETHFKDHINLAEYASQLAITEARLNDICRRMASLASKEMIHDRLLQEARRQLRFSAVPVSEISYQLGFADPAYFSRFFTRRTGVSPSQFRIQCEARAA
jgi:AraC family 4-hydroxyphenylacetate 3-monooxygenase operon regulatory protein